MRGEENDIISDRGLRYCHEVEGTYGDNVQVYESSAADGPHLWVKANSATGLSAAVHLHIDDAVVLAEQLLRLHRMHHQKKGATP